MRTYEAMFLFDPSVGADQTKVQQEVERLMKRAGAEIIMSKKWDERKLAYEIKGRKRGCYVLTFFRADQDKITPLERDVELSESILRVLILKADHLTEEDMNKAYVRSLPMAGGPGEGRGWRSGGRPPRGTDDRPADARPPDRAAPVTAEVAPKTAAADAPETAASTAAPTEPEPKEGLNQPE